MLVYIDGDSISRFIIYEFIYELTWELLLVVFVDTSVGEIEDTFKTFTNRSDIAIILINQIVSNIQTYRGIVTFS